MNNKFTTFKFTFDSIFKSLNLQSIFKIGILHDLSKINLKIEYTIMKYLIIIYFSESMRSNSDRQSV